MREASAKVLRAALVRMKRKLEKMKVSDQNFVSSSDITDAQHQVFHQEGRLIGARESGKRAAIGREEKKLREARLKLSKTQKAYDKQFNGDILKQVDKEIALEREIKDIEHDLFIHSMAGKS